VSGDPLLMAGICDAWYGADGSYLPSLAIITMDANTAMQDLHQRMPVLFNFEQSLSWLDHKVQDPHPMQQLIMEASNLDLEIYPVSKAVNSAKASGPLCLQRIDAAEPDEGDTNLFDLLDDK